MINALKHRGPDGQGIWAEPGVVLAHRRLSIVDPRPTGAQPMQSACGRYVIAFNGEIYNHFDLRQELETEGGAPHWYGYSDTETLLASISRNGLESTLRRVSGMFAIALWDKRERLLSLARDPIGEKPLYWGWAGDDIIFGSELKALRCHPSFSTEVCPEAMSLYMQFGYVPAPHSIYSGIFKLEPGCVLHVHGNHPTRRPISPLRPGETHGSIAIRRYWSLNEVIQAGAEAPLSSDTDAITAVDAALRLAVRKQMIADVPLGAFLSGGIDSSLIVSLMQTQSSHPVKTFTVGFEDTSINEAPAAAAVARHLGTDHFELIVTDHEARNIVPQLADIYDEPFADPSQIPTHLVCKIARTHVTVALSGDAGDELFGGYNRYVWGPLVWKRLGWLPHPLRRAVGSLITRVPVETWDQFSTIVGSRVTQTGEKAHRLGWCLREAHSIDELYRSLVSDCRGGEMLTGLRRSGQILLDDPLPSTVLDDATARMMVQDIRTYLPDDVLCKVDRAAMAVSLETRIPFLDPDVLKISAMLPSRMKIRDGKGKWALRQILYQHVPRALIERPKAGFGVPLCHWLRGPLRNWAEDLLCVESLQISGLIDPNPVRMMWAEHISGRRDWANQLWKVLMFVAWWNCISSKK